MKSYILLIECKQYTIVRTKAKEFALEKGIYAYVGSCGISCVKRICRHLNKNKSKYHWHIDFLMKECYPLAVLVLPIREKELAKDLCKRFEYVKNFGSTDDSDSPSHLFRVRDLFDIILTASEKSRKS
jgi:Uri superfamily endonuclease